MLTALTVFRKNFVLDPCAPLYFLALLPEILTKVTQDNSTKDGAKCYAAGYSHHCSGWVLVGHVASLPDLLAQAGRPHFQQVCLALCLRISDVNRWGRKQNRKISVISAYTLLEHHFKQICCIILYVHKHANICVHEYFRQIELTCISHH